MGGFVLVKESHEAHWEHSFWRHCVTACAATPAKPDASGKAASTGHNGTVLRSLRRSTLRHIAFHRACRLSYAARQY